ncbi:MgtC/SapB family protein [Thermodesulfobacteriota bacterium]
MEFSEFLLRIFVAAFLGGLIGLERDIHGRAAGLRTHLLVSLGSALFMVMSELVATHAVTLTNQGLARMFSDPGRIAAQIVTGIGFLGAGTIIKEGLTIRGLTTAACLWLVAAVGMAAGGGYLLIAISTTFIALTSLIGLHYLEWIYPKDSYRVLTIETPDEINPEDIVNVVTEKNIQVVSVEFERDFERRLTILKLHVHIFHKGLTDVMSHRIVQKIEHANIPVKKIIWSRI